MDLRLSFLHFNLSHGYLSGMRCDVVGLNGSYHKLRYPLYIVAHLQFVARGLLPHHHGDQVSIK